MGFTSYLGAALMNLRGYPFLEPYRALVVFAVVCLILAGVYDWNCKRHEISGATRAVPLVLLMAAFSSLGVTVGLLAGDSRNPAVDVALSGILTVYGGLVIYFFGKDVGNKITAALSLFLLTITVAYGMYLGAAFRLQGENEVRVYDQWQTKQAELFQADLDIYKQRTLRATEAEDLSNDQPLASKRVVTVAHP